jgi:hypothetical protein
LIHCFDINLMNIEIVLSKLPRKGNIFFDNRGCKNFLGMWFCNAQYYS